MMKHAEVIPLFKSGLKNFTNNYRPISLLLTLSKILEKLMYSRIYEFLDKGQIYDSQYGFQSKHSCENAITELISAITKGWENKQSTLVVYLDLSKAFDTLQHSVLFDKLEHYGIRGNALDWFKSYLNERSLSVKCQTLDSGKGVMSEGYPVEYGSPEGSCLGPLLFLVFCNDLYRTLEICSCILFADDTTLYKTHADSKFLEWSVNEDLKLLSDWFKANKLTLNLSKTMFMYFPHSRKCPDIRSIHCDGTKIPKVSTTKFLGVWIDDSLNWKHHTNMLIIKLQKNIWLLKQSSNFLDVPTLKTLYYTQIFSNISYCMGVRGNHISTDQLNKIQKIQNKCVSIICKRTHVNEINYKNLQLLKIKEIIKLENLKIAYKLNKNLLPKKISECALSDQKGKSLLRTHNYGTRAKSIPYTPKTQNKKYGNSILCESVQEFRTLKGETQNAPTMSGFVSICKREIFNSI